MAIPRFRRAALVTLGVLACSVLATAPVVADTPIQEIGQVGDHQLVDTSTRPGATCEYTRAPTTVSTTREHSSEFTYDLPGMKAAEGSQEVGWRFLIYRRWRDNASVGLWELRYRSARQVAVGTIDRNAQFTWMSVPVAVPQDGQGPGLAYDYLVHVRMVWYDADGSVSGRSLHEVDGYRGQLNGFPGGSNSVFGNDCQGWLGTEF